MRVLLQRVLSASVSVDGSVIGQIERGLLAFVGICHGDTEKEVDYLVRKVTGLRLFPNSEGKMDKSILDLSLGVLVISQFTLYAECNKGRRPDFSQAARPDLARPLVDLFIEKLKQAGVVEVTQGQFGADMKVSLINDGPVTLLLESV